MGKLKTNFPGKYPIGAMDIFEYDNPIFIALNVYNVRYFEFSDDEKLRVVYLDQNINACIQIVFMDNVVTDYLLLHMQEKGMLK